MLQENQKEYLTELNKKISSAISLEKLTLNDITEKITKHIRLSVKMVDTINRTKLDKEISESTQKLMEYRRTRTRVHHITQK